MTWQRFQMLCTDSGARWEEHEVPFLERFLEKLCDDAYWFFTYPEAAGVIGEAILDYGTPAEKDGENLAH